MITKIYSQVDPAKLLHIVVTKANNAQGRTDIIDPMEHIQCAILRPEKGTKYRPHKHFHRLRSQHIYIPQESWVVIKGTVKVYLYDLNDQLLHTDTLSEGDASFTLEGGHTYEIMSDNTFVYEYKTGPYLGQEADKIFI
jgi:cupin fold WbuC family metalloprotein